MRLACNALVQVRIMVKCKQTKGYEKRDSGFIIIFFFYLIKGLENSGRKTPEGKTPGRWLSSGFKLMITCRQPPRKASQRRADELL